ncbi:MAG TPA: arginine--tRNA ligase [Gemmatales bacterium]|nr:arginine--tRNA ligase [Gemmatales bacterium]HMP60751.1 arginine--tRNA ligase [Gemmatales bacterium]
MNLLSLLEDRLQSALTGIAPEPTRYRGLVKPTKDAAFGDYQANCAMGLAKELGAKPRDIAEQIATRLREGDLFASVDVAGPGFINLKLRSEWIAESVRNLAGDERLGIPSVTQPLRFVIDYSSPNVAKPMHVGHLRSTIIGDALTRLLRFLGHSVVTDNHLGDWGTQFGMLIHGWRHHLDPAALEADPIREMTRLYVLVRQQIEAAGGTAGEGEEAAEDAANPVADACRAETAKLHAGDPENNALWTRMMPWCLEELNRVYRRLGILPFDHILGESAYNPLLPGVAEELAAKGIAEESQGALIITFGENQPIALIRKRDGAFTYMTTDLATIRKRVDEFQAQVLLYVVDFRQALHFQQLFTAARRWGYDQVRFEHVQFGSVLGKDGRPIKTREGGAVELAALLDEAVQRARQIVDANSPELSDVERAEVAEQVGIGAVKYADLSQNRASDYRFSWEKMLAMDGNTAAYMQYAVARVRSIFRKHDLTPDSLRQQPPLPSLATPAERLLAVQLLRFPEAVAAAAAEFLPHLITGYLWDLANAYSGFYQQCPVLKAETAELRQSRLLLCDLTARTIEQGLALLGIGTPERM